MVITIPRERERERETNLTQQSQLLTQIIQLEQNPTLNQNELEAKRKKLKELQEQERKLTNSLPLNTQISILEREIKELENKSNRSQAEEAWLADKKQELERLLVEQNKSNTTNAKPTDKTVFYISLGIGGILLILGLFILVKKRKKRPIWA